MWHNYNTIQYNAQQEKNLRQYQVYNNIYLLHTYEYKSPYIKTGLVISKVDNCSQCCIGKP
jgi:hypothetical protein